MIWYGLDPLKLVNPLMNQTMKTELLKRVCSLKTKQLRWTFDGQLLLNNWEVATLGRINKLSQLNKS